nr:hypothetical protein [Tanacetum cinerariifolium]
MSQDVITVGSTMRIPLLYQGEYSQWSERFKNYLEEKTEEKRTHKIDRLARSLLIQGLSNDTYSLIDSKKTTKDLWDALERKMRGSEYGEQDRKAAILYEYETFKATEREQLLDTYLRYLQVINDLKTCGYKKDNCELNYKFLNNLQPEWKQYGTLMRQTKNLIDINIDALYNILKQNQGDVNDALGYKKKAVVVTSDPFALVVEKTKVSKRKEKVEVQSESEVDHNDSEENDHLVEKLIEKFNYKIAKCQKRIEKANQQSKDLENQNKDLQDIYNVLISQVNTFKEKNNEFNEQMKVLNEKNADLLAQTEVLQDQLKVKHVVIDTHTECQAQYAKFEEERYKYMIRYSALCDNYKQHRKKIDEQEILFDKMSRQLVEMNNNVLRLQEKMLEKETNILELEGCVSNKDLEIEKCLERLKNKSKNGCQVIEKVCDTEENPNVIAPGMFKLSVSQSVSPISVTKTYCASNSVETKLKRKRHLDTLSSVRRPKPSGVMWMKKGSSNTVKADLSYVNHSNLNKNVKRYSRKNLMACNNSDTRIAFDCNNARNALCNARINASVNVNDWFVFDDVGIRKSHVSKMPFRKKPSA